MTKTRQCIICGTSAKFGIDKPPTHCMKHKLISHKRVVKACSVEECDMTGNFFGASDGKRYCSKHKPSLIRKHKSICVYGNCTTTASFLLDGKRYCSKHKLVGSTDFISKLCKYDKCSKNPVFGYPGKKNEYCKEHKLDDMIDVKNIRCKECSKQASYGYFCDIRSSYCLVHKLDGMVEIRHMKCLDEKCNVRPSYSDTSTPKYCIKHKKDGMRDVVSKMCIECGNVQASFGIEGCIATHCVRHKSCKMIHMGHKCEMDSCYTQPVYNTKGTKMGRFCFNHKEVGMIDVLNPTCKSCGMITVSNKRKLCNYCNPIGSEKVRENRVADFLTVCGFDFIRDTRPHGATHRFRPDFFFDRGTHVVILEVDEKQHKKYPKNDEIIRMECIQKDLDKPTVFLRYNPDVYRVDGVVTRIKHEERHKILKRALASILYTSHTVPLTVYKMYYNVEKHDDVFHMCIPQVKK
jgi:hypothetical protein